MDGRLLPQVRIGAATAAAARDASADCRRLVSRHPFPGMPSAVEQLVELGVEDHVTLRMDRQMFLAVPVHHEDAIVILMRVPSHAGGLYTTEILAQWQAIPWHVLGVVDAPGHQRLVGIALLEDDHHLVANAGPEEGAPAFAGPELRDAEPAGTVRIHLPFAIPMKLDFHASILVDEDLLARRTDDRRGLQAGDYRLFSDGLRAEVDGRGQTVEFIAV